MKSCICAIIFCIIMNASFMAMAGKKVFNTEQIDKMVKEEVLFDGRWFITPCGTNDTAIFFDPRYLEISDEGNIITWQMYLRSKTSPKNKAVKTILKMEYGDNKFRVLASVDYDKKGRVLSSYDFSNTASWNEIIPGSVGEASINWYTALIKSMGIKYR